VVSTRSLPPGGEAEIKAQLRTTGIAGPVHKQITVFTNDPTNPRLVLSLAGEVVADVVAKPRRVSFGEVAVGTEATRALELALGEGDNVRIAGVRSEDGRFRVTYLGADESHGGNYEIKLADTSERGVVASKLVVSLTGGERDRFEVPVSATVVGDLRYPKTFTMQRRGDDFVATPVTIVSRSGKSFEVRSAEDPAGLLVASVTQASPSEVRLEVTATDAVGDDSTSTRGTLIVKTSDADEPTIEISYSLARLGRRSPTVPGAVRPKGAGAPAEGRGQP
jgi:hypothetical protein